MKNRLSKLSNQTRSIYVVLLILIVLLVFFIHQSYTKNNRFFSTLSENFFLNELSHNSLSLHYTLSMPEDYQLDGSPITLPTYSNESMKQSGEEINSYLSQLAEIDITKLDEEVIFHFNLLTDYLQLQKESLSFPFYSEPLAPSSGAQSQLPILLAEYQFRQKEDIKHYLTLLSLLPDYFSGLAAYEKDKSEQGLFMDDYSLNKVISQCSNIMDFTSLQNDTHFLITTFVERLIPLVEKGIITQKECENYIETNRNSLIYTVAPSYVTLADSLLLLKGSGRNHNGLCSFPDGASYYELLIKQNVGTSRPIPEIKAMLLNQLKADQKKMEELLDGKTSLSLADLPLQDDEAMILHLQDRMQEDFPSFPNEEFPFLELKTVSPYLANFVSPAFYLTPPIDDISSHVIYRNPSFPMNSLDLYTTLAHEGYPGHLYQSVYYLLENEPNSYNLATHLLSYSGYAEGWAYYVENIAYSYANDLVDSNDIELYRLNQNMKIAIYCLLDIGIHYEGFTYEDCSHILSNYGIIEPKIVRQIFEYIVEEPSTYLKYYVGYLEMLELQKIANFLMEDTYSDLNFHQFVLELGPAPFEMIREQMLLEYPEED